jgi:glutaminyl-tRNA synthetase
MPDAPTLNAPTPPAPEAPRSLNFIEQIIEGDNDSGKWGVWTQGDSVAGVDTSRDDVRAAARARVGRPRVHTRFPPEPNGYLHLGHAKSICLNAGLARAYGGKFNLRFDDTNPVKEEREYIQSILRDVLWLGADWTGPSGGGLYYASDYFDTMVGWAMDLIQKGKAYVCELKAEEVSARRGKPGVPATSPFRDRPAHESLRLFREMLEGKHPDGAMTVRAKIDLASPNFNLRDPVMYRILHEEHPHAGARWCVYPMYDWAHGLEDSLEEITHSVCTLEFEDHRPLYDWFIDAINEGRGGSPKGSGPGTGLHNPGPANRPIHHAQQIEFAKLIPTYTVMSKRNLLKLVQDKTVAGWDDPRMPTISGMRRRGYTPESIQAFCADIGVTKADSLIDVGRLENAVRDHLNKIAPRVMGVLRPLKVIIESWEEGKADELDFVVNPEDPAAGKRKVPFSREIYIERDDFMENPPKKFFRLAPGQEVRLRWAYIIRCTGVEKDAAGNITAVRATHDPATRGGDIPLGPDGKPVRKVQGTIHWVSAAHAARAEVRLIDRLFNAEEPGKRTGNPLDDLNPASIETIEALVDPWLLQNARVRERVLMKDVRCSSGADSPAAKGPLVCLEPDRFQFERLGYFGVDPDSGTEFGGTGPSGRLVLNRIVTLKDSWAKAAHQA